MSGQRRWLKMWARTVGMPIGLTDEDKPEFLPITQTDVQKALWFRTFWIVFFATCRREQIGAVIGQSKPLYVVAQQDRERQEFC